jgi:hypothetical protein
LAGNGPIGPAAVGLEPGKEKGRKKKEKKSGSAGDSAQESFRKFLKAFHFQIAFFKYQTNLDSIQI